MQHFTLSDALQKGLQPDDVLFECFTIEALDFTSVTKLSYRVTYTGQAKELSLYYED